MATIREYFDTDPKALTIHAEWSLSPESGQRSIPIVAKIAWDFEANAKFWYFYIPDDAVALEALTAVLAVEETRRCTLSLEGAGPVVEMGHSDYSERQRSTTLAFTGRIHLYVDRLLTVEERQAFSVIGLQSGFHVSVRDREYAVKRSQSESPLAFISHDSRDKDEIVRELANKMTGLMCPVWYDEYSLTVGASLRATIEKGLKTTKKCVLVLSPNFLANNGWGKAEFDSIFTREILSQENVVLPVWHNVTVRDIYDYSPRLADKVGLSTTLGIDVLARRLVSAIKAVA